jgi:3-hydroxy-3-methylglutaryl CoA synthase
MAVWPRIKSSWNKNTHKQPHTKCKNQINEIKSTVPREREDIEVLMLDSVSLHRKGEDVFGMSITSHWTLRKRKKETKKWIQQLWDATENR